ncbi:MAG: UDP-glucose/GDP-mannose dehydrogenase family protein [Deltaproteobacteria bacterium]|jgi:UDPglucose 6-dehydrogenase|nr:UDP-glucose/GDP-mannose dehydrogenase family protein [Deltaproteobacteria bacterium]
MNVVVVGTGYVGLVTGACFAEMGHMVTCVDVDEFKIKKLREGIIPIYEPGLESIVLRNIQENRLNFVTHLSDALSEASVVFIAVGTPPGEDGSADLQHVLSVAREIGQCLTEYKVIVTKSTVPVGTADKVRTAISETLKSRSLQITFDVASNPEFLKEGAAVEDFMKPDRVVIGADSERAEEVLRELYSDFCRNHDRIIMMGVRDAEMTKYTANAMLATKISFMNEVANLCDLLDVDVENVRLGIGSDSRIGYSFIYPGCGYGGSCFPKDVRALIHTSRETGYQSNILEAVHQRNEDQKHVLARKVIKRFGDNLSGLTFALWGLSFKPGTDDMREAPSVTLLHDLIAAGAKVNAYDPEAIEVAERELPRAWFESGSLVLVSHQYEALEKADALILVTEWKPFRHPDFKAMQHIMKQSIVFDGRNLYDPESLKSKGYEYFGIGRH